MMQHGTNSEGLESLIEARGLEPVVLEVLESLRKLNPVARKARLADLEEACGVEFGEDAKKWVRWIENLKASGSIGFGPRPSSAEVFLPDCDEVLVQLLRLGMKD